MPALRQEKRRWTIITKKTRMEKILNIYHYCLYLTRYRLHLLVNRVNLFRLIHKLPMQKRKYEELGINIDKEVERAFSDKKFGLSILVSGGLLIAFIFLFIFSLLNYGISLINIDFRISKSIFISIGILSFSLCYVFVFRKDKYLCYFEKFDASWGKSEKKRNIIYSVLISTGLIVLFFLSLF